MEKVDKIYSLNNSYFKNRKGDYPDTILEIACYQREHNELPFAYSGDNWAYDAMCERQKRFGVRSSQYLTPDKVASQIAALTDNFNPEDMTVLNACCGIGQLIKPLLERGFNVEGFDGDREMTEICEILYPQAKLSKMNFMEMESDRCRGLIVANPPHELKLLRPFMEWLSSAMSKDGKTILILPAGYMKRSSPSSLAKILKRFNVLHEEGLTEDIPFTATKSVIQIVELSQEYKDLYFTENLVIKNNIQNTEGQAFVSQKEATINKIKLEIMEASEREKTYMVPLEQVKPNPENPRKNIKEEEILELAQNIKKSGLLQPVTLRPKENYFEIVCGERRSLAFLRNGETHIPAYIKELSDIEVMEMALAENLLRKDLTPMEESNAFLRFIETGKYTVEDLANTFGKTENYIRSRLRLLRLTDNFRALLDNGSIVLGIGLELSKYDLRTQGSIFKNHFVADDNSNWKDLGIKELAGRIERAYTTDLSKYKFDKGECEKCQFNTGTYSLFSDTGNCRCTNEECLKKKRTEFTMGFCKVVSEQFENVEVCITPYDKLEEATNEKLEEQGIKVITAIVNDYPEVPCEPVRVQFTTEQEYRKALDEHRIDVLDYNNIMDEIQEKILNGEMKKVVYIGDNNPKLGYIPAQKKPDKDPLKILEEEDTVNKKQAMAGVIKDVSRILQTCLLPISGFTEFEEQAMMYLMLDSLDSKHYPLFGIKDATSRILPDDLKYKLSKSLTSEQKDIIKRDFIIKNLVKAAGSNSRSLLLVGFTRQHFPQETTDISKKYSDSYNVKYQKIKKQMDKLNKKEELIGADQGNLAPI